MPEPEGGPPCPTARKTHDPSSILSNPSADGRRRFAVPPCRQRRRRHRGLHAGRLGFSNPDRLGWRHQCGKNSEIHQQFRKDRRLCVQCQLAYRWWGGIHADLRRLLGLHRRRRALHQCPHQQPHQNRKRHADLVREQFVFRWREHHRRHGGRRPRQRARHRHAQHERHHGPHPLRRRHGTHARQSHHHLPG